MRIYNGPLSLSQPFLYSFFLLLFLSFSFPLFLFSGDDGGISKQVREIITQRAAPRLIAELAIQVAIDPACIDSVLSHHTAL